MVVIISALCKGLPPKSISLNFEAIIFNSNEYIEVRNYVCSPF